MKTNKLIQLFIISLLGVLSGCSGSSEPGDGGITGTGLTNTVYQVNGTAQKGPFLIGSTVDVSLLAADGSALDTSLTTETTDSLGNFSFTMSKVGPTLITVNGYHFNELNGQLSSGTLTLRAIANIEEKSADSDTPPNQKANVNILTHLIHGRIITLMAEGKPVLEAITIAEQELTDQLEPLTSLVYVDRFSELSIYNDLDNSDSDGNNYLLFISAAFYQHATNLVFSSDISLDAKLSEILNNAADDFRNDGDFDDAALLLDQLQTAATQVDPDVIENNLEIRSRDILGESLPVADISSFLNQLIITFPANNSIISGDIEIRFAGLQPNAGISYNLLVDGEIAQSLEDGHQLFEWSPYYWSANSDATHTLIIEAKLGDTTFYSNLINVILDDGLNNQLILTYPIDNEVIRNNISPALTWEPLNWASSYQIQVFTQQNQLNPVYDETTVGT